MQILNFDQFSDEIELGSLATLSFEFDLNPAGPFPENVARVAIPSKLRIHSLHKFLSGVRNNRVTLEIQYRTRVTALIGLMLSVLFCFSLQPY